jgi:hypothetical protein
MTDGQKAAYCGLVTKGKGIRNEDWVYFERKGEYPVRVTICDSGMKIVEIVPSVGY